MYDSVKCDCGFKVCTLLKNILIVEENAEEDYRIKYGV
jgi:hypothetical protein